MHGGNEVKNSSSLPREANGRDRRNIDDKLVHGRLTRRQNAEGASSAARQPRLAEPRMKPEFPAGLVQRRGQVQGDLLPENWAIRS